MAEYLIKMTVGLDGVPQVTGGLERIEGSADKTSAEATAAFGRMAASLGGIEAAAGRMATGVDSILNKMTADAAAANGRMAAGIQKNMQEAERAIAAMNRQGISNTDRLAQSFETLGIRSTYSINQLKNQAISAFEQIKQSGVAAPAEIARAQTALQDKIQKLNQEIAKTPKELNEVKPATDRLAGSLDFLQGSLAALGVGFTLAGVINQVKSAVNNIDSLKISTIQVAAQITTMQGPKNVEEHYKNATIYADDLAKKLQEVDANSFANYQTLLQMTQTMTLQGVVLDTNNKKQVASFTSLSNAIAMMTAGQNQSIQAHQEIRALMSGEVNQGSQLAKQINEMAKNSGLYKDGLKEIVAEGKKHGDTLERLAPFLVGVNAASGDISKTWQAIISSAETAYGILQRAFFKDFFNDATQAGGSFVSWLKSSEDNVTAWGKNFMRILYSLGAEIIRMGMLLDKIGGTATSAQMLLYGPGKALGVKSSTERFDRAAQNNLDFEARYNEKSRMLEELALKMNKLEETATRAGKAVVPKVPPIMGDADKQKLTEEQKAYQKHVKGFLQDAWDNAALELAAEDFSGDVMKKMGLFTDKPTGFTKNPTLSLGTGQLQSLEQQADAVKALDAAEAERLKTLREQVREYERQRDIIKYIAALEAANRADEASMVGMNSSGGFDSIADQTANALAIQKAAHEERLRMIDVELQAAINKGLNEEQTISAVAARNKAAELERQKNIIATGKIAEQSFKSQLSMAGNYVGMASQLFSSLADAQDESSRQGFEASKNYNKAAVIMSTAAGIMNAFATSNNIYAGVAMAAVVFAAGVAQYKNVDGATYGGGGSITGVSGGGGAGSSPTATVGKSIGSGYSTAQESQSFEQMQSIASSMENASMALTKVADGLTNVTDLFTEGSLLQLIGGALQSRGLQSDGGRGWRLGSAVGGSLATEQILMAGNYTGELTKSSFDFLAGLNTFNLSQMKDSLSAAWEATKSFTKDFIQTSFDGLTFGLGGDIFGGKTKVTGQGIQLGLQGGQVTADNYMSIKTDGGYFHNDKKQTLLSPNQVAEDAVQTAVDSIASTIKLSAAILTTTVDVNLAEMAAVKISTAGKDADAINKEIEAYLVNASNAIAENVVGLQDFAAYGEDSFAALVRLSTSLQGVNDSLALVDSTLIESTLSGANAAFKLADLFGGMDKFTESVDTYFTSLFTDTEQEAAKAAQAQREVNATFAVLKDTFKDLNVKAPETREEFKNIVSGLDKTTESGAQTFAALMGVAESFGVIQSAAEELAATNNNLMVTLYDLQGKTVESIMLQRQLETEGMDPTTLAIQNQIYAIEDLNRVTDAQTALEQLKAQTIQDSTQAQIKMLQDSSATFTATAEKLKANLLQILDIKISANQALLDIMGGNQTVLSPETLYQQKKAAFEATKGLALGGNAAALTSLPELAKSFLDASQGYNASGAGYQSDFASVTGALATIAGLPSTATLTLDIAQQQLFELKKIQEATTKGTSQQNVLLTGVNGGISGMQSMLQSYLQAASSAQAAAAAAATAQAKAAADTQAASQAANTAAIAAAQAILDQAKAIASAQAQLDAAKAAAAAALALAQAKAAEDAAAAAAARAIYSTVPQDPLVRAANAILHPGQEYWLNNVTGVKKWLPYGEIPSFAIGTPYLQSDGPIYAHQGERILPAADNYAITKAFVEGQSGNKETVAELKETNKHLAASVRVLQAGFNRLIDVNERQEKRLAGVEAKTKLQAAA